MRLGKADEGEKELKEFQRLQQKAAADRARDLELGGLRREAQLSSSQRRPREGRHAAAPGPRARAGRSHRAPQPGPRLAPRRKAGRSHRALQGGGRAATRPAEVHQHLAEAYAALGRADDSRRELEIYEQLTQERLQRAGAPTVSAARPPTRSRRLLPCGALSPLADASVIRAAAAAVRLRQRRGPRRPRLPPRQRRQRRIAIFRRS